ncbi:MAG: adenylate/guanylate cyclase domain-containing protein [Deltaproteobacteria bacterium]|nr:adenylate/guanylate cyclase domain-containing protein [Deltaproteobacteria bacterium]
MTVQQRLGLEAQMHNMASTITDKFANDSKMPLLQNDHLTMNLLVQNLLRYEGIINAYILDEKFFIAGHKELQEVGIKYYGDEKSLLTAKEFRPWLIENDRDTLTFASPISFKKTTVGYVVVIFSKDFIKGEVKKAQKKIIVITISVIIIVIILSIPLASGLLKPIFMLVKGTREIAMGNLWYRIPPRKRDEIGDLIDSFNHMTSELEKKEILKGAFNRYVSKPVADEILKNPEKIQLGGERREITVIFADIREFTALTRQMQPEAIVELLNRYFTILTEVIFHFDGTVDKFIGDAVMGVFGSPIPREDHLKQGIKAAVVIKKVMSEVNRSRDKRGLVLLPMGLGLDSGDVIVGSMGSKVRMEYTAIGDAVNVSSRLTGIAKEGEILISEKVYLQMQEYISCIKLPDVNIKGITGPFSVYNLLDIKDAWKAELDTVFNITLDKMRKDGIAF